MAKGKFPIGDAAARRAAKKKHKAPKVAARKTASGTAKPKNPAKVGG